MIASKYKTLPMADRWLFCPLPASQLNGNSSSFPTDPGGLVNWLWRAAVLGGSIDRWQIGTHPINLSNRRKKGHYEPINLVYLKNLRISSYDLIFCAIAGVIKAFDMLWSERSRILSIW